LVHAEQSGQFTILEYKITFHGTLAKRDIEFQKKDEFATEQKFDADRGKLSAGTRPSIL
jgi:hypothetical protein